MHVIWTAVQKTVLNPAAFKGSVFYITESVSNHVILAIGQNGKHLISGGAGNTNKPPDNCEAQ